MTTKKVATPKPKTATKKSTAEEVKTPKKVVAKKPAKTKDASTGKTEKAKVSTVKKSAAGSATVKAKAPAKKAAVAKPRTAVEKKSKPTPEERYRMVQTAAYFVAERNGFQGDSTAHWAAAEREIAALLKE